MTKVIRRVFPPGAPHYGATLRVEEDVKLLSLPLLDHRYPVRPVPVIQAYAVYRKCECEMCNHFFFEGLSDEVQGKLHDEMPPTQTWSQN